MGLRSPSYVALRRGESDSTVTGHGKQLESFVWRKTLHADRELMPKRDSNALGVVQVRGILRRAASA